MNCLKQQHGKSCKEMHRVVRPGGYVTIMDMNPHSEIYAKMPPYILTLLKSTEPYLDQYFALDIAHEFEAAGFERPTITCNSPRHRTIVARSLKKEELSGNCDEYE
jgi:hypothetical protein